LRLAVQVQGEKQLSLTEQFYTDEKVVRLTGARGAVEWVKINTPEVQPDGTTRYLNDITATAADFVVAEQDYNGTMRQVMFEQLNKMAGRLAPDIALRLLRMAMEFSDLPNKDEISDQIRQLTGEQDPNKEMTPEQAQQAQAQMQQQAEALQLQRETAMTALEEQRAKVKLINAQAEKIMADLGAGQGDPAMEGQVRQIQTQAAQQIEQLSAELRKAQTELANRTMQINKESDIKLEVARIDAATKLQVAEIQSRNDKQITALEDRINEMLAETEEDKAETPE
jgi:multidrug efflux pump subunit AcrA (membrane-fusion protein)